MTSLRAFQRRRHHAPVLKASAGRPVTGDKAPACDLAMAQAVPWGGARALLAVNPLVAPRPRPWSQATPRVWIYGWQYNRDVCFTARHPALNTRKDHPAAARRRELTLTNHRRADRPVRSGLDHPRRGRQHTPYRAVRAHVEVTVRNCRAAVVIGRPRAVRLAAVAARRVTVSRRGYRAAPAMYAATILGGVPVQAAAGMAVPNGGSRVSVGGGLLHVAQRHCCAERGSDECCVTRAVTVAENTGRSGHD
jgi:hypothetical protein